jgi:hypothetical protein
VISNSQEAIHLRYDEDLVEAAVVFCTTGRRKGISSLHIARFHREREKLYSILDPDERNTAFFKLHLDWFREWGLETLLTRPLQDFPLLPKALQILAFGKARGKNDDGTELYVNEAGDRNGVVALRPERLEHEVELSAFLHHELTHLHDMVDPGFGYLPQLAISSASVNQHRLARERYRLLWDVSIDGRLSRAGRRIISTREQRWLEFVGSFNFWAEARQREIFDLLWSASAPTHCLLEELVCDPRQLQSTTGPQPGAACPLCGFPTFAWADEASLGELGEAIRLEFPFWALEQGACKRCFEIYRVQASPSPVVL